MLEKIDGYKTYILVAVAAALIVISYFRGEIDIMQTLQLLTGDFMVGSMRSAIKKIE